MKPAPFRYVAARTLEQALQLKAEYGDAEIEAAASLPEFTTQAEVDQYISKIETEMREAARKFEFEKAAKLRDSIKELREKEFLFGD